MEKEQETNKTQQKKHNTHHNQREKLWNNLIESKKRIKSRGHQMENCLIINGEFYEDIPVKIRNYIPSDIFHVTLISLAAIKLPKLRRRMITTNIFFSLNGYF
jgi:hypothetical protein